MRRERLAREAESPAAPENQVTTKQKSMKIHLQWAQASRSLARESALSPVPHPAQQRSGGHPARKKTPAMQLVQLRRREPPVAKKQTIAHPAQCFSPAWRYNFHAALPSRWPTRQALQALLEQAQPRMGCR